MNLIIVGHQLPHCLPEDGCSIFLRNVTNYIPVYTLRNTEYHTMDWRLKSLRRLWIDGCFMRFQTREPLCYPQANSFLQPAACNTNSSVMEESERLRTQYATRV